MDARRSRGAPIALAALLSFGSAAPLALIDSLWNAGEREPSLRLTDSLLAVPSIDPGDRLGILLRAAARWASVGEPGRSETASRAAMELALSLGDSAAHRSALRWLSVAVSTQGRAEEARGLYRQLHELAVQSGDSHHEAWALVGLGWDAFAAGDAGTAVDRYARAASLFSVLADQEGEAWARNGLGVALVRVGRIDEARAQYERAATLARGTGFRMVEAMVLNNLAGLEFSLGDPGVASAHFARAEALQRAAGHVRQAVMPALNVAICQVELGRYEEAASNLERLLAECEERKLGDVKGDVLTMLARLAERRGFDHRALEILHEILEDEESLGLRTRVECRIELAELLARLDQRTAALAVIDEATELLAGRPLLDIASRAELEYADLLLSVDRCREAQRKLGLLIHSAERPLSGALLIEALVLEAEGYRCMGQPDSALAMLGQASELWELERGSPLDPEWRERRGQTGKRLYSLVADLSLGELAAADGDPSGERTAQLLSDLFDRLQRFKARTLEERMLGPGPMAAGPAGEMPAATMDRIQSNLEDGELFLDVYLGAEGSLVIAVSRDQARAVRLPPEGELEPRLSGFLELISAPPTEGVDGEAALRAVSATIHRLLFSGVADLIAESELIVVCPDGLVTLLPFAYMHACSREAAGEPSARLKEWLRVPSAAIWLHLRRRVAPATQARLLAVAGSEAAGVEPLPGARAEIEALSSRYRNVTASIPDGSEDVNVADLSQADVFHLASHLEIDDQHPWQSGFLVGGGSRMIRAREISMLDKGPRLVVLASCASAAGRVLSGEGVLGVSSAFLSAGASSIVATLWPVDDRVTHRFMKRFYADLAGGEVVASALRAAQESLRQDPRTHHPFYWAGFVVIGDPAVRVDLEPRGVAPAVLAAVAGLVVVLAAAVLILIRSGRRRPAGRRSGPGGPAPA